MFWFYLFKLKYNLCGCLRETVFHRDVFQSAWYFLSLWKLCFFPRHLLQIQKRLCGISSCLLPLHPSFTNMNCMWPSRCWRADPLDIPQLAQSLSWNTGVMRLSHFSQPPDKALTPQLRLVPLSSIESQGQSPKARVKVIGWQPPTSCIWTVHLLRCIIPTHKPLSLLFLCLKGQPCQTLHGISSTCWLRSDDLCKTLIEMQVIAAESPTQPPLHRTAP